MLIGESRGVSVIPALITPGYTWSNDVIPWKRSRNVSRNRIRAVTTLGRTEIIYNEPDLSLNHESIEDFISQLPVELSK